MSLATDVAHLNDDDTCQSDGSGGEDDVAIEITGRPFDAVPDVLDKARGGERIEGAKEAVKTTCEHEID